MDEVIEPLDPADAAAITEGVIAPDDARPVDEPDTDTGLDSERIVLVEDPDDQDATPEEDSNNDLDYQDTPEPSEQ